MISVVGDAVGATRTKLAFEAMLQDIARIARLSEPVLRNLLITLRYHALTISLARVVGPTNANWATFATWASKTAGESIRGELVPGELAALFGAEGELEHSFGELKRAIAWLPWLKLDLELLDVARAILDEVSAQIATNADATTRPPRSGPARPALGPRVQRASFRWGAAH